VEGALPVPEPQPITPKQQESSLRREIEIHVRRYCQRNRVKQQSVNTEIKNHFGKSRQQMSNGELGVVLEFVQRNYPTGYQIRGRRAPVNKTVEVFHGN